MQRGRQACHAGTSRATAAFILDIDERRQVMAELEAMMQEDGPIVQPVWRAVYAPADTRVLGFVKHPTNYVFGETIALAS